MSLKNAKNNVHRVTLGAGGNVQVELHGGGGVVEELVYKVEIQISFSSYHLIPHIKNLALNIEKRRNES